MPKTQLRLYDWGQYYEKMLYDNAQLVRAYLHAWQITEGEEGKFYVWTLDEIRAVLQEDSEFFEAAYGVTERGNWEGKTVLQRALDDASLAARFGLDANTVPGKLADSHAKLFAVRSTRIRPGTDDKILTAWNGLMLATIAESARVLGDPELQHKYLTLATRNADFLLDALRPNNRLRRSWRQGKATKEVFLEDYAALILGLIELYQKDFQDKWFGAASAYPPSENGPALLKDRPLKEGAATSYVCEGFVCKMPVNTSVDLQGLL